ncbi:hypothetical protein [Vibrio tetraodonis]|uniref:hypothetical protein n=1 Tax=Vibrio tetraodonis TaxID=2231647 RepID=UPI000E0C510F|nr:hypothetical protein [Vibrio tetraodonis]
MKILAHRGLWTKPEQKNTREAFVEALKHGFGIETDVRDYLGELVISHDIANKGSIGFSDFLSIVKTHFRDAPLAINVKADGLQNEFIGTEINKFQHFYFDMSIPDALIYSRHSLNFYTRHSDIEPAPNLLSQSAGVWMDNFSSNTLDTATMNKFLSIDKNIALVSPELHGYDYERYWVALKEFILCNDKYTDKISLCTDYPQQAQEFFNE